MRQLGPLWTHSCFPFEDNNRIILKLIHGTQKVEFQIVSAVNLLQKLLEISSKVIISDSVATKLYGSLTRTKNNSVGKQISREGFILGQLSCIKQLPKDLYQALAEYLQCVPVSSKVYYFHHLRHKKHILHARTYERVTQCDSTVIAYFRNDKKFFIYEDEDAPVVIAQVQPFVILHEQNNTHIVIASKTQFHDSICLPIHNIIGKMFSINNTDSKFRFLAHFRITLKRIDHNKITINWFKN